ncbi:MAG TPA: carbonic anhydrase [Gemmatimonadales bacterium]|nr:carbonic anhydrase [Gemmatimonadales bacterium]
MSAIDEVIQANDAYARSFDRGDLALPPRRRLAILTCMDARILPGKAFGLEEGDAHVIRNAGGRARDALRSLVISQRLLGTIEVAVVHHTDCGMLTFTNRDLRAKVQADLGRDTGEFDFQPFQELDASVREDVDFLVGSELLDPKTLIRGFVYDVTTGRLREVELEAVAHSATAPTA